MGVVPGNYIGNNCPRCELPGGNCLGGSCLGAIVRVVIVLGENCPRVIAWGAVVQGGICSGGIVLERLFPIGFRYYRDLSKVFLCAFFTHEEMLFEKAKAFCQH